MNGRDWPGQASRGGRLWNSEAVERHNPVFGAAQDQPRETVARIDLELGQLADPHVKSKGRPISMWVGSLRVLLSGPEQGLSWGGPGPASSWSG
jgi:hypothetical protein